MFPVGENIFNKILTLANIGGGGGGGEATRLSQF